MNVGDKAKITVILNPWVRYLRGRVVTVIRIPSTQEGYDADVRTRDGIDLAVNWTQLQPKSK